jgi:hypothetical protein
MAYITDALERFSSLSGSNYHKLEILDFVYKHHIPIDYNINEPYHSIYMKLHGYYIKHRDIIISSMRSHRLKKQYADLMSRTITINFRLTTSRSGNLQKVPCDGAYDRPLVNTTNLMGDPLKELDSELVFVCWDNNNLYGFDLRELNQLVSEMRPHKPLINPYTNNPFDKKVVHLIVQRIESCTVELDIEQVEYTLDLKITELVNALEIDGHAYVNDTRLRSLTNIQMIDICDNIANHHLIQAILTEEHKNYANWSDDDQLNEKFIDMCLHIVNHNDSHKSTRCLVLARALQGHRGEMFGGMTGGMGGLLSLMLLSGMLEGGGGITVMGPDHIHHFQPLGQASTSEPSSAPPSLGIPFGQPENSNDPYGLGTRLVPYSLSEGDTDSDNASSIDYPDEPDLGPIGNFDDLEQYDEYNDEHDFWNYFNPVENNPQPLTLLDEDDEDDEDDEELLQPVRRSSRLMTSRKRRRDEVSDSEDDETQRNKSPRRNVPRVNYNPNNESESENDN